MGRKQCRNDENVYSEEEASMMYNKNQHLTSGLHDINTTVEKFFSYMMKIIKEDIWGHEPYRLLLHRAGMSDA